MRKREMIIAAGLAMLGGAAAAQDNEPHEPARAKEDVRSVFMAADYPSAALRNREEGTVRARLSVGANGEVLRCEIVQSSGSSLLDETTCRILVSRTSFAPARNAAGEAVDDVINTPPIRWQLPPAPVPPSAQANAVPSDDEAARLPRIVARTTPDSATPIEPRITNIVMTGSRPIDVEEDEDALPRGPRADLHSLLSSDDYPKAAMREEAEGTVRIRLDVDEEGKPAACTVELTSGYEVLDRQTCDLMLARAQFDPARDADGNPVTGSISRNFRWELPGLSAAERITASGVKIHARFNDAGELEECAVQPLFLQEEFELEPQPCTVLADEMRRLRDIDAVAKMADDQIAYSVADIRFADTLEAEDRLPDDLAEEGEVAVDLNILALTYDREARKVVCETLSKGVIGRDCAFLESLGPAFCQRISQLCEGRWISFQAVIIRPAGSFEFTEDMK